MMFNNKAILTFSLIFILPNFSWAWHDYDDTDWNWYGSGRDHPYSYYVDNYYVHGRPNYAAIEYPSVVLSVPGSETSPVTGAPPPAQFTITIPNTRGGYNAVVIKKSGGGFIGPDGEFYPEFPKIWQLQMRYGDNR